MANTCVLILLLSVLCVFYLQPVNSVKPDDEIYLTNFNQSFYLANETYTFFLKPRSWVPRQILRHTIYTSSREGIQSALKRAIFSEPGEVSLAPDDHQFVTEFLQDTTLPLKVDKKKRALPVMDGGLRIVPITSKASLIATGGETLSMKRGTTTQIGTSICLHVPFFTTCDNSEDLSAVKNALTAAVDAIHTELDDYKKVNDDRAKTLAQTLNAQRDIIDQLAQAQQDQNQLIANVAEAVQTNAAEIMDGDYQVHSQVNYLKRITNSLLKYANALASTDPRATVAQPSMSKLFQGYVATIQNLTTAGFEAIVDNSTSTAFTWAETLLPSQSVSNSTDPPCTSLAGNYKCISQSTTMTRLNPAIGFSAIFAYTCDTSIGYPSSAGCVSPAVLKMETIANWIYGPFHKNHYGIYTMNVSLSASSSEAVKVMRPIVIPRNTSVAVTIPAATPAFCANFLGFKMFSSVYDPSLSLVNSYKPPLPAASDCDALRLLDAQYDNVISAGILPTKLYSLYGESEGIVIPFYSNCDLNSLQNALYLANPSASVISTLNYICSNAWTLNQPTPYASACATVSQFVINSEVLSRHWVSSSCYINLEPGWLQLDYYVNPPLLTIPNIPRGYQLNQFTINAYGELASSLEFVYTDTWLPVYTIIRTSQNRLITDEISLLENSPVLFYMDQDEVIDESDSMFGKGNNGRDCIQKSTTYDYNLLNCFFQNLSPSYPPNLYLSGSVTTSGISRYNSKFDFTLSLGNPTTFSLTPKKDLDFSYYVQMDGNICPKFTSLTTKSSGCIVSLYYTDKSKIVILAPSSASSTPISVNFVANSSIDVPIGIGTWSVNVGGKQCFILDCSYTIQFNVVQVSTPNVEIRTAADKALIAQVEYSSTSTLAKTVADMEAVISDVSNANVAIDKIRQDLENLNFDPTTVYPYENFTDLRNGVKELIANIPSGEASRTCDGPLDSIKCWFIDSLGAIVGIGLIVVVLVIFYIVGKKAGLFSYVMEAGHFGGSSSGQSHIPEYRAD